MYPFCNKASFYSEELLAPHPPHKLEHHPLSAFCNCVFNIFAAAPHIGGCSSICSPRICHVTRIHLSWSWRICYLKFIRGQENSFFLVVFLYIPYFLAHKTHHDFFIRNFRKKIMINVF